MKKLTLCVLSFLFFLCNCSSDLKISGELKEWHKITLTVNGPYAREKDDNPNPFLDYKMTATFTHNSGNVSYQVPGYFAADGNSANTSADSGKQWRAHFAPDRAGLWNYKVQIFRGKNIAIGNTAADEKTLFFSGGGSLTVKPTDKSGRDFRSKGRLQYVGQRYLKFAGNNEYFLKAGADSPENLLAYYDFDGTYSAKNEGIQRSDEAATTKLKTWQAHIKDWQTGDPAWQNSKGKGLIGAVNYLSGKGCNAFSFLTYNAGGDGDDVWPYINRNDKLHFDCSKLDQWQIVFDHAQKRGMYLHFKLQETENDDNRIGDKTSIPESLDGGESDTERKLYLRELIARFAYELALNWNLGEENSQTTEQQIAMARYIKDLDPYRNHIVLHTYPDQQEQVYDPLLGEHSPLTGISLQNGWQSAHQRVLYWIKKSAQAGKQWVVANDEQNPHYTGVPPDSGYEKFSGIARPEKYSPPYSAEDIRKYVLWGVLMAGGAGVEYYFGYTLPQNDLGCQDWRSRDQSWDYCNFALSFFNDYNIPFWAMDNADSLLGNNENDNSKYCLAKPGYDYLVYLPDGGSTDLDLGGINNTFSVDWYNPRTGGPVQNGSVLQVKGPGKVSLGLPPADFDKDWCGLVRLKEDQM
jgi:Domain of unknown function (DUF5060)/Putative collagen-binding domain of a collagenase